MLPKKDVSTTGLDQFLYAEKICDVSPLGLVFTDDSPLEHGSDCLRPALYIADWEFSNEVERAAARSCVAITGLTPTPDSPHAEVCRHAISTCVAYWRKANAIHGWFITNCANGVDECQVIPVSHMQLGELVLTCRKTIATQDPTLLSPMSGFFFGSTNIDEWYWNDLQETINQLAPLAEFPGQLYYRASW